MSYFPPVSYTLPPATGATLGGVVIGANIANASGTISLGSAQITGALGYTPLSAANNLSDLANAATARTNLALAASATTDTTNAANISSGALAAARLPAATGAAFGAVITGANITNSSGTISLGSTNITGALGYTPLNPANNLSDVAAAATARTNLGLGTMATQAASAVALTGGTISGVNISYPVRVVTASGGITMVSGDLGGLIVVNKTTGAATAVTLIASPATGAMIEIKDGKGDAASNNITITPAAGNIDGAANFVLSTAYAALELVYNGTQWNVV